MRQVDYTHCVETVCEINRGIKLERLLEIIGKVMQDDELELVNVKPLMTVIKESRVLKMLTYKHGTFIYYPLEG